MNSGYEKYNPNRRAEAAQPLISEAQAESLLDEGANDLNNISTRTKATLPAKESIRIMLQGSEDQKSLLFESKVSHN